MSKFLIEIKKLTKQFQNNNSLIRVLFPLPLTPVTAINLPNGKSIEIKRKQ